MLEPKPSEQKPVEKVEVSGKKAEAARIEVEAGSASSQVLVPPSNSLPACSKFCFKKAEEKLLPGKSSKEKEGDKGLPSFAEADCLDTFGVVSMWYQNFCYTDGGYNNNDYKVEKGELAGCTAYTIHPPQSKFKNFLGSQHHIALKVQDKAAYNLYKFEDGQLEIAAQLHEKDVKPGQFNITPVSVSEIAKPLTYLIEKASKRISPHQILGPGVEGSTIHTDHNLTIEVVKMGLPDAPYTPESFTHGPDSHYNCYSPNRNFWRIQLPGKEAVVWESPNAGDFYLTHFSRKDFSSKTTKLETKKGYVLGAATGDSQFLYYSTAESGEASNKKGTKVMFLTKADIHTGKILKQEKIPTGKNEANVFCFDTCNLALSGQTIAMVVSRRMTQSDDGLNHQGGYACVFQADTLAMVKGFGQTSGHSFANSLAVRSDGKFMGMDLGDNYPRGINCWNFDEKDISMRLVYTFKTLHGSESKSPAGVQYP